MDKVKVKNDITEILDFLNELVAEGKLDGDAAVSMMTQFINGAINKEIQKNEEVV